MVAHTYVSHTHYTHRTCARGASSRDGRPRYQFSGWSPIRTYHTHTIPIARACRAEPVLGMAARLNSWTACARASRGSPRCQPPRKIPSGITHRLYTCRIYLLRSGCTQWGWSASLTLDSEISIWASPGATPCSNMIWPSLGHLAWI